MKINFNKVSDEESSFELLEEGMYLAKIVKIEEKESKSGNDMWAITFETEDEQKVFDYLVFTEKTLNRVKKYYSLCGFDFGKIGDEYEPETDDLLNKQMKISVTIEDYTNGQGVKKQSNKIDLFRCEMVQQNKPKAGAKAAAAAAAGDDERPF